MMGDKASDSVNRLVDAYMEAELRCKRVEMVMLNENTLKTLAEYLSQRQFAVLMGNPGDFVPVSGKWYVALLWGAKVFTDSTLADGEIVLTCQ